MKKIQLLTISYILFFVFFTTAVFAQNISGTFEGLRKQYDNNQENFAQEFQYKYELIQKGETVTGISTIYNEKGDYAEVRLRGMVLGNVFYFEEYEIVDEMKSDYTTWCYKTGELKIETKGDKILLVGKTKSYTSNYGAPCTGGYTELAKTSSTKIPSKENSKLVEEINVSLYPNPTSTEATITFELNNKNKVSIELYDLSGRLVSSALNETLEAGNHQVKVNVANQSNGLYIVKISIGKEVYSKQLVKATL